MARDELELSQQRRVDVTDQAPVVAGTEPPARKRRSLAHALLIEARPKQWVKNLLVFAAPGAAGVLGNAQDLRNTIIAFVAFCLAASGTYYLNDASDAEADRRHPKKRFRPIAAGEISVGLARVLGPIMIVGGVALGLVAHWQLSAVVLTYVIVTTTYTYWWKHIAVVDIVAVAAGFVLRAIGGAAATGVEISNWFFIVTSFAALFVVVGKRHSESLTMGDDAGSVRATLGLYSANYLQYLRAVTTGVMLVAYCLWAFDKSDKATALHHQSPWFELSIVPFTMAILRYALLVDQGEGGAPEDLIFKDRPLLVFGLLWVIIFGIGILVSPGVH